MKFVVLTFALSTITLCLAAPAAGSTTTDPEQALNDSKWLLELETGPTWFKRNNVRIPNDTGTRFDMLNLTDNGPDAFFRLYVTYNFNHRHGLRLNIAPLAVSGTGLLASAVLFQETAFAAGVPTSGRYKFNNYRLTYRWMFHQSELWDLGLGGALLIRDAEIALRQGGQREVNDDLGVVPLLHLYGAHHLSPRTSLILDFEGAAAPQGRAVDVALKLQHQISPNWHVHAGYRTLEGGANNKTVYTFAWLHYATFGLGFHF